MKCILTIIKEKKDKTKKVKQDQRMSAFENMNRQHEIKKELLPAKRAVRSLERELHELEYKLGEIPC